MNPFEKYTKYPVWEPKTLGEVKSELGIRA